MRLLPRLAVLALVTSFASGTAAAARQATARLEIRENRLGPALVALAQQLRLELLYPFGLAEYDDISPVVGEYTASAALTALLTGTHLVGEVTSEGVITVSPKPTSEDKSNKGETPMTAKRKTNRQDALAGLAAGAMLMTTAVPSDVAAQNETEALEEVLVTARKREERLLDVPLSVQAFSASDLEAAGIIDLEDLTLFSPGLDYNSQSSTQFAGRYLPAIRFRGLTTQSALPSNQVGSLFIDGVFVLGGAQSIGFEDVERVEVIKGPQAAYFGRSTFGGAINYITADPAEEFGGRVSAEYSPTYQSHRGSVTLEGPLIEDRLSARLTLSSLENGAYYTATDGGDLGEETTDAFHGTVLFTPTDAIRLKFRASYIEDEDTQPATTAIQFFDRNNCGTGTALQVLDGSGALRDVTLQAPYWCGGLPDDVKVTANTRFTTFPAVGSFPEVDIRDIFVENSLGIPEIDDAPSLDHFGLRRETIRLALSYDVDLDDAYSVSGNVAYNDQKVRQIADRDFTDAESVFMGPPNFFEDYSGELRLQYDAGGRFRGLIGVNYYQQEIQAAFTNAVEATNELSLDILPVPFSLRVVGAQNSGNDNDEIETFGIFGSVEYDIFENLTFTFEGRWQEDKVTTFGGQFLSPGEPESLTEKEFLPRAILTWKPMDSLTTYLSYSEGTLPGTFNSAFLALPPDAQDVVRAENPGLEASIPPEELKSLELGVKQALLGGRLTYAVAVYSMQWENMKSAITFLPPGATGLQGGLISGSSEITGVEFEGTWVVNEHLEFAATANITDAEYEDFAISGINRLFGLTDAEGYKVDGNQLPQFPEETYSLSGTYTDDLSGGWSWYSRLDVAYQGRAYTDPSNINYVKPYTLVNLRGGVRSVDGKSLEIFWTNLFDERGWAAGGTGLDLGTVPILFSTLQTRRGAVVTALRGREFGVRATWSF